ncbi:Tetrahedral aminopeptidase [Candidatus Methanobinarius endosymbioticus]|uniref:Tetrahedral aminopeptidase n=1 Tax=Candidatus Methanobinarius endosymbioticus TaxID=2006182 RepID=A0A366MA98_9EURY|nr:Tetrahedral aminopeptidase [Candidatus Methanobinarius endosymbioticus]
MDLMKKLSLTPGISGFEGKIVDIIKDELNDHADEIEEDLMGNVIALKKGEKNGTKVMLASHMDEIGLMIRHVDKEGFIRFSKIGGINDQMLLNQTVTIHGKNGNVTGVIGSKPPHIMKAADRKKIVEHDSMFIDIGVFSREEAEKYVTVGDPISFKSEYEEFSNDLIMGKALDNRVGCYIMIETMKRVNTKATVYGVGTVQEEVGLKGAKTSSFKIDPDMAFALDVTIAGDHPGIKEDDAPAKIGKGPAIILADGSGRGIITPEKIKNLLVSSSEKANVPYQLEVGEGGTTDASAIHLTREGIPTGIVSVPARYIHTTVSIASMEDVENTINLLVKAIDSL